MMGLLPRWKYHIVTPNTDATYLSLGDTPLQTNFLQVQQDYDYARHKVYL